MQYFDITKAEIDKKLYLRLGFTHIFVLGDEIKIAESVDNAHPKRTILATRNDGLLLRHIP